ncbi:hypothetical protein E2C01_040808 [Portunus trituberculatus]|uniref:Uncharacterized protein n=1 Tax=Portunus trituberculatus TaxID=210409 RepID=A0A5B7FPS1_PORTR|nr:hypothetical protein [Portunus trituberculatus]
MEKGRVNLGEGLPCYSVKQRGLSCCCGCASSSGVGFGVKGLPDGGNSCACWRVRTWDSDSIASRNHCLLYASISTWQRVEVMGKGKDGPPCPACGRPGSEMLLSLRPAAGPSGDLPNTGRVTETYTAAYQSR